jgi:hypothetical protein
LSTFSAKGVCATQELAAGRGLFSGLELILPVNTSSQPRFAICDFAFKVAFTPPGVQR